MSHERMIKIKCDTETDVNPDIGAKRLCTQFITVMTDSLQIARETTVNVGWTFKGTPSSEYRDYCPKCSGEEYEER